jgi:hypothetical protein
MAVRGVGGLGVLFATLFMGGFYVAQAGIADTRPPDTGVENLAALNYPIIDTFCPLRGCAPVRPRLLHLRTPVPRAPEIFCVSPDDPDAVMPCEQMIKSAPASRRGAGGN